MPGTAAVASIADQITVSGAVIWFSILVGLPLVIRMQ